MCALMPRGGNRLLASQPECPCASAFICCGVFIFSAALLSFITALREKVLRARNASLGATLYRMGEGVGEFLGCADRALYASKSSGRDRVTVLAT